MEEPFDKNCFKAVLNVKRLAKWPAAKLILSVIIQLMNFSVIGSADYHA